MKKILITLIVSAGLFQNLFAQGKVGINTSTPAAMLHVKDSSVVFTGPATIPANAGQPPVIGAGNRMMWYADKAAFRAGHASTNQWDKDNIGQYSIALGYNTTAWGTRSTAMGHSASASGVESVALGRSPSASGNQSVAIGSFISASGTSSTAMGFETAATGSYSTALGYNTNAVGTRSTALGSFTTASGTGALSTGSLTEAPANFSFSAGISTDANAYGSAAFGRYNINDYISLTQWIPEDPLFVVGNGTSESIRSNALTVLKNGNVGIGNPTPGAPLSFSGTGNKISLYENNGNHFGFGIQTSLLQIFTDNNAGDIAFGYGSSTSFTERMRIKGNGNVGIANNDPAFKLDVNGRMRIRHGADGSPGTWYNKSDNTAAVSFIGLQNDNHIGIYSDLGVSWNFLMNLTNGNIGIGVAPAQKLHVSGNGLFIGTVTASCGLLVCSDLRYKTNIRSLTNSLSNVLALRGIYYEWDKETFPEKQFNDKTQIGFAAQELEKIYPEMVHTDEEGYKTVDYSRLTPVLVEAIKEQQSQIDILTRELDQLKVIVSELSKNSNQ